MEQKEKNKLLWVVLSGTMKPTRLQQVADNYIVHLFVILAELQGIQMRMYYAIATKLWLGGFQHYYYMTYPTTYRLSKDPFLKDILAWTSTVHITYKKREY